MDKEYIVTLYRKEDLEQFYNEMKLTNFPLVMKRPLSRNTHYMMTEEQAERLRQDSRVWGVERVDSFHFRRQVNREPYTVIGNFWKDDTQGAATVSSTDRQWGHIHCAGDQIKRGKGLFGPISQGGTYEQTNDSVEVFSNGKHVDVVIVDDPVSYDSEEWYSPTSNQTRFVQYQWFNELNTLVNSIDDDSQTEPTGTITYGQNSATPQYHGIHVTGTATGQHYGWAREANIYNIAVTDLWPSGQQVGALLIFDYLRAFHKSKPVNPETGFRNPTITNHSYGGIRFLNEAEGSLQLADIGSVVYRNTTYTSSNPNPSGWTEAGLEADCGIRFDLDAYPSHSSAVAADVQDAIDDGVVIIGAAGNDNLLMDVPGGDDWNNRIVMNNGYGTIYYNRGAWPNSPDSGAINVGALSKMRDFRRSTYTMFGPGVDVFSPGDNILSAYGNTGLTDSKYTQGSGNYYYPIQGTSMASPQVCGVIACVASGKYRFTQGDAKAYLNNTNIQSDMTFDLFGGGFDDDSCRKGSPNKYLHAMNPRPEIGHLEEMQGERTTGFTFPRVSTFYRPTPAPTTQSFNLAVTNSGASDYLFSGSDRQNTWDFSSPASDPTLNFNVGDEIIFDITATGHPFWIKTSATTGTGNAVTANILGNGSQTGSVIWDLTGIAPGTYYYICQFHSGMVGQIIIS